MNGADTRQKPLVPTDRLSVEVIESQFELCLLVIGRNGVSKSNSCWMRVISGSVVAAVQTLSPQWAIISFSRTDY